MLTADNESSRILIPLANAISVHDAWRTHAQIERQFCIRQRYRILNERKGQFENQ